MRAEILSVGTELLLGSILNTNSRFLSKALSENAIDVYHQTVVGDNIQRISEAFETGLTRSDMVISSGGLGPTEDDATIRGLAAFVKQPLQLHRPTYTFIQKKMLLRGYKMNSLITKQCFIPRKTKIVFQNANGTAPGLIYELLVYGRKKWAALLPGPPAELEPMFTNQVLPFLLKNSGEARSYFLTKSIRLADLPESKVAQKIPKLLLSKPPLTVGIYAKPSEVELKIMAKHSKLKTAKALIRKTERFIQSKFGRSIFGVNQDTLASSVIALLKKRKMTISVAESCTGGLLGHLFTEVPGASGAFMGGIIAYSNSLKTNLLEVPKKILAKHGAVSSQTARYMSCGVKKKLGSNIGIAITGIMGPNGQTRTKPIGLVYISISTPRKIMTSKYIFRGSRSANKVRTAKKALNLLRLELL